MVRKGFIPGRLCVADKEIARKSATRMYINNFADKGRQNTIDMVLVRLRNAAWSTREATNCAKGRLMGQAPVHLYDPINDYVTAELSRRFVRVLSFRSCAWLIIET